VAEAPAGAGASARIQGYAFSMVAFTLFPALDLRGGRVARMVRGDPSTLTTREATPLDVARAYVDAGARWIHVVDLDAAVDGVSRNGDVLERVARLGVPVQAGGGLDPAGVEEALRRGAARAIVGSRSIAEDRTSVEALVSDRPERVGLGLDVRSGRIAPRGSPGELGPALDEVLPWVAAVRPTFVVYTDVARDGTMAGPDLEGVLRTAEATGLPVISSGGVRSLGDLQALAGLAPAVAGAVVGRALRDGVFTLEAALDAVAGD
jgi:phosphoribosylformimino-5-aminoimidazole carboxamide ribotide isomerase